MVKLKSEIQGKEYLIDVYETLHKNLQFDHEFYAIADVVEKMFSYDVELATEWTLFLLNRYGTQGLRDSINDFDYQAAIRDFIDCPPIACGYRHYNHYSSFC